MQLPVIRIELRAGQLRIEPHRATVSVGVPVQWHLDAENLPTGARWLIGFDHGSPFRTSHFVQRSRPGPITITEIPEEAGSWSYGVRVVDPSGALIAQGDPSLVVVG